MIIILEFFVLYVCIYNIYMLLLRINELEYRKYDILKMFLIVNFKIFAIHNFTSFEYYRKWKHFSCQWSLLLEEHWFVWSFLTSSNCYSDKSSLRKRMSVETWWNDTERGKKKPVSMPHCPHKYHTDGPRIDFLSVRWDAGRKTASAMCQLPWNIGTLLITYIKWVSAVHSRTDY